jgi:hypothetical protein
MVLSIAAMRQSAKDLGFPLMKHADQAHVFDIKFENAYAFFPRVDAKRCDELRMGGVVAMPCGAGAAA